MLSIYLSTLEHPNEGGRTEPNWGALRKNEKYFWKNECWEEDLCFRKPKNDQITHVNQITNYGVCQSNTRSLK